MLQILCTPDEAPTARLDADRRDVGADVARLGREFAAHRSTLGLTARPAARTLPKLLIEAEGLLRAGSRRVRELQASEGAHATGRIVAMNKALIRIGDLHDEIREHCLNPRLARDRELHDALVRLRRLTSPTQLMDVAAAEATRACGFRRVGLARVDEDEWAIEVEHHHPGAVAAGPVSWPPGGRCSLVKLAGERAICSDPYARLVDVANGTYVVAPVSVDGAVIALFFGDHGPGSRADEFDRDALGLFADGLGLALERAVLAARVTTQRAEARRIFLEALDDANDVAAEFTTDTRAARAPFAGTRDDDPLTARQRQVLNLMASGATSARIADELDISQDTVKTHAKNIMVKLSARSRADAISKYLLLQARGNRAE